MDILKLGIEWAKAEVFSAKIVWLLSFITLLAAGGFSLWSKTATAKAFVIPLLVSAILLAIAGIGLYVANKPRITQFEQEYQADASSFIKKEIERTSKSEKDFNLVFKVLPAIIILAAIGLMIWSSPNGRAISIVILLTCTLLMAIDSNTAARNAAYREQLLKSKV